MNSRPKQPASTRRQCLLVVLFFAFLFVEVALAAHHGGTSVWSAASTSISFRRAPSASGGSFDRDKNAELSSSKKRISRKRTSRISSLSSILPQGVLPVQVGLHVRAGAVSPATATVVWKPLSYYLRVALAGGVAGATGTVVLYPMDSAKTLRQSHPTLYTSVRHALMKLIRTSSGTSGITSTHNQYSWHIARAYRGIWPAALGAIPSSALYFGAYESSKITLQQWIGKETTKKRILVHGLAAACGNILSSAVFVPKEVIKQQLQISALATSSAAVGNAAAASAKSTTSSLVWRILQDQGVRGLYSGYQVTLMRNIPSAMLRFVVYEELKQLWGYQEGEKVPLGLFAAGAVAGAFSSCLLTPVDVLKTRLATGTCPVGVNNCMMHVVKEVGWQGLYAGAGSRMMWSGAFSAIGFGTFEIVKGCLGVADSNDTDN